MDSNFSTKTIIKKYKDKLIFTGIFLLSFVTKFAGSNYFINTDAAGLWRYRIEDFWTAIANFNLELMPEVYHGITLMWLSGLSLEIANFLKIDIGNPDIYLYVAKFPLIAVVSLTTAYAYILFKKIFNNRALSTAICFFILIEPMFLFHAKNIHTNALAFCFSLLCVLHFFLFLKNKNKKELFFSALFMSLSLLTRSTTMIVFFAISVFYLFFYSEYKLKLKYLFYWFGLILLLFFIFWPSLWVHPLECADYFFEKIMFGVLYPHDYINSVSAPVQQYFFYFLYVLIKMPLIILSFFLIFIFL
ncbi:glycosyltransferase family 39 protein, partial [Candidatus Parcubacteria bacterium]|nr:glycosyltransferase family 39 protein [Candidatus Parcubacteria bacterium]